MSSVCYAEGQIIALCCIGLLRTPVTFLIVLFYPSGEGRLNFSISPIYTHLYKGRGNSREACSYRGSGRGRRIIKAEMSSGKSIKCLMTVTALRQQMYGGKIILIL